MAKRIEPDVRSAETNKPERGAFVLLDVDSSDDEFEASAHALGQPP